MYSTLVSIHACIKDGCRYVPRQYLHHTLRQFDRTGSLRLCSGGTIRVNQTPSMNLAKLKIGSLLTEVGASKRGYVWYIITTFWTHSFIQVRGWTFAPRTLLHGPKATITDEYMIHHVFNSDGLNGWCIDYMYVCIRRRKQNWKSCIA
jgi:hypothetical protein